MREGGLTMQHQGTQLLDGLAWCVASGTCLGRSAAAASSSWAVDVPFC